MCGCSTSVVMWAASIGGFRTVRLCGKFVTHTSGKSYWSGAPTTPGDVIPWQEEP